MQALSKSKRKGVNSTREALMWKVLSGAETPACSSNIFSELELEPIQIRN
jgi:hypothetical protein